MRSQSACCNTTTFGLVTVTRRAVLLETLCGMRKCVLLAFTAHLVERDAHFLIVLNMVSSNECKLLASHKANSDLVEQEPSLCFCFITTRFFKVNVVTIVRHRYNNQRKPPRGDSGLMLAIEQIPSQLWQLTTHANNVSLTGYQNYA